MVPEYGKHRHGDALVPLHGFQKSRCLGDVKADIQTHHDQCATGDEGKTPSVGNELLVAEVDGEQEKNTPGANKAERGSELGKHAVPGALPRRGVFGCQQDGASPFTAKA